MGLPVRTIRTRAPAPARTPGPARTVGVAVSVAFLGLLSSCSGDSEQSGALPRLSEFGRPSMDDLPRLEADAASLAETERDWAIARRTVEWARDEGLGNLPVGQVVAIVGSTFVGTPYVPGTLEIPGPERLVVNLHGFDCVTLVEHALVMARLTVARDPSFLRNEQSFRERYRSELTGLRYRDGVLSGYPSRLHYFSEWIGNAEAKGLLRNVTRELGGVPDPRPIDFMSSNRESYRQLGEDPAALDAIRATEQRLNTVERFFVPQDEIAERESGIQDGDIIAAVSALDGLDIAHTGIALWQDGRLHLMHAPLVGDSVQISELPLAERIQGISGQIGIMVARPVQP